MVGLGTFVRLDAKSSNPNGHIGSMRIKATRQHSQSLRTCRQHGTWPGFWQPASVHGRPLCAACSWQPDTSSTLSGICSIAMAHRRDWHARCTSLCRGNAFNAWREPSPHVSTCDGHHAGSCYSFQPVSSCPGCSNSFGCPEAGSIRRE